MKTVEKEKIDRERTSNSHKKDLNNLLKSENHVMTESLVSAAQRNITRRSNGYRHENLPKAFAAYIKMIGGTLTTDTLHANLPLCWPSRSTSNKFINDNKPTIVEGKLRTMELLNYLKDRNLPLRVSLSEDATRINPSVSYDPKTNQLVGFPLPLDTRGMPIPYSFLARNVKEIREHYDSNITSSNAYVQMAQPLSRNVPPFCLMTFLTDNRFKAETVLSRWNFTTDELRGVNIKVDNYASDGDSRQIKVMKFKSEIGVQDLTFLNCEWFSCGSRLEETYTQDIIHVGGKARNRILKTSRRTPIGQNIIAVAHLFYLIRTVSKDKHLLNATDINPKDRQNFQSVEKICSEKVISYLGLAVPGSEGTAMFLKALNYCLYSYLDQSMRPSERVYKHWYGLFFFRVWRSWLLKSKEYTLKECFISTNCYLCLELNAHALVKQELKWIDDPEQNEFCGYKFLPEQQGSQACEMLFRQARSFSSMYSNVVNFTMLEFMNRMNKMQLQADIINTYASQIKFPRFEKKERSASDLPETSQKLTKVEIIELIEKAKQDLTRDIECLGMNSEYFDFHCQINPTSFEREFSYDDVSDDDSMNDETELLDDESLRDIDSIVEEDNADLENDENDRHFLSGITGDIELTDYSTTTDNVVDEKDKLTVVVTNTGKPKSVMKSAIVWYFNDKKGKLSSDRLERVRARDCDKAWDSKLAFMRHQLSNVILFLQGSTIGRTSDYIDVVVANDYVALGDWCVFDINGRLLVGLIVSFRYINGKNFKEQAFSKSTAQINSGKAVGVLSTWYNWNFNGDLIGESVEKHQYVNIDRYRRTLSMPTYTNNKLSLSKRIIESLESLTHEITNSADSYSSVSIFTSKSRLAPNFNDLVS